MTGIIVDFKTKRSKQWSNDKVTPKGVEFEKLTFHYTLQQMLNPKTYPFLRHIYKLLIILTY